MGTIQEDRQVVLGGDRCCLSDHHLMHGVTLDIHTEDRTRLLARIISVLREFDATGLTPIYREGCVAPFIQESNIQIAAEFVRKIDVEENGTLIIIARIMAVYLPEDCIGTDGYIDVEQVGSITCVGLDSYHRTTRIGRLPYAKP